MTGPFSDTELSRAFESRGFISRSAVMLPILRQAYKAAVVSDVTVLLEGETGTGKQVLAQAIHELDEKRKTFPFVTVHCATISDGLAESELFGHRRGSFSGAVCDREGLFRAAEGGTLFLDDINDLPLSLQPKLLDVLQRKVVRGIGCNTERRVNVRVIVAANEPLAQAVEQKRFRGDLYYRLNVVRLRLPALRERSEELAALVLAFAGRHKNIYSSITEIDPQLIDLLHRYSFPGNVRELEHAVERMLFSKSEGSSLQLNDWQESVGHFDPESEQDLVAGAAQKLWAAIFHHGMTYDEAMRQLERTLLQTALRHGDPTRREVAVRLRTSERTLYHRLRVHNLSRRPAS
jgi:DNA-binding NtrC family response regulator